jgi:hypothetical protein
MASIFLFFAEAINCRKLKRSINKTLSSQFVNVSFPSKSTIYEMENKFQKTCFLLWKIKA